MTDIDVIGFGALNVDRLIKVDNLQSKDTELVAREENFTPGGSAANSIYALGKLGLCTAYMGALGNDSLGSLMINSFKEVKVNQDWIVIKDSENISTGEALCLIDDTGRRLIILRSGANRQYCWLDAEFALHSLIPRSRLLHLTSFADDEQLDVQNNLVKQIHDSLLVTCVPGAPYVKRGRLRIWPILERCDYVFFNREEITGLMEYSKDDYLKAATSFIYHFPRCRAVVITLGQGKTEKIEDNESRQLKFPFIDTISPKNGDHISSFVVEKDGNSHKVLSNDLYGKVQDTTGAGDAYTAGFIFGILTGQTIPLCARMGYIVAQYSILSVGARNGLPERMQLQHKLEEWPANLDIT